MTREQLFKCKHCGDDKPVSEFQGDSRGKHGIVYRCKECRCKQRAENGEYSMERLRKYAYRKGDDLIYITVEELEKLLQKRTCTYCGCALTDSTYEPTAATVDHIYSLSKDYGGANIAINIVPACRSCNSSKQNDHVYDFYRRSEKFTPELWTQFVREYSERMLKRKLTDLEVEQMKENFAAEAEELRRNAEPKAEATG